MLADSVATLASNSCVELFAAYDVTLTPSAEPWAQSDEVLYSGVMGFAGDRLRGTCVLAATQEPLEASCPRGGRLRDWVGELSNQLVGRLKMRLIARGVETALTTPVVLSGVRLAPLPRAKREPHVFAAGDGLVLVWVEVESEPSLVLGPEDPNLAMNGEGEALLF